MTYPPDGTMCLLCGLWVGGELVVRDGRLWLESDGLGEPLPVTGEALDELETRGWVVITEAGPDATEAGGYWLRRWFTARGKRTVAKNVRTARRGSVRDRRVEPPGAACRSA